MLSIEMLGGLRITPAVKPKKAKAILAYLAWAARPVRRATIAGIFWPYQSTDQSLHSVRNVLYELRRVIGDAVIGDFFDVSLRSDYYSDLHVLRRLLAAGDRQSLETAVILYRGPLLHTVDVGSEPWREWVSAEAEAVNIDMARAMSSLAQMQSAAGDHDEALITARKLALLDSYDEGAVRLVMRELVAGGRKAAAIGYFRSVVAHLKCELGCAPDSETTALFAEISGLKQSPNIAAFPQHEHVRRNVDKGISPAARVEAVRAELDLALTGHAKLNRKAVRAMIIELGKAAEDLRLLERAPRSVRLLESGHRHAIA